MKNLPILWMSRGSGLVLVLALGMTWVQLSRLHTELEQAHKQWLTETRASEAAHAHISAIRQHVGFGGLIHAFKNYLLRGEPAYLAQVARAATRIAIRLDALKITLRNNEMRAYLEPVRQMTDHYREQVKVITQQRRAGRSLQEIDRAVRFDDQPALEALEKIDAAIAQNADAANRAQLARQAELRRALVRTQRNLSLVVLLGVVFQLLTTRYLVHHLRKAAQTFDELARGHTNVPILYTDYQNEIGDLARSAEVFRTDRDRSLQQAHEELQRILATLSHDLREPVRKSRLLSGKIRQELEDVPTGKFADRLTRNLQQMERQLDRVADYMAIGQTTLRPEPVDLTALCEDLFDQIRARHGRPDICLATQGELPEVQGDQKLLAQMLLELIENALKFHDDEGAAAVTVSCTLDTANRRVLLHVDDNGPGFPQSESENLFELLRAGSNARQTAEDYLAHTGTGLAIARKIARLHRGEITATTSPTAGCRMIIDLPA